MLTDLEQAIKNLRTSALRYDKPERYYRGDHDLAFATAKFENAFGSLFREFALNLCPAICDAVRDKLKITGFSIAAARFDHPVVDELTTDNRLLTTVDAAIDAIWDPKVINSTEV